MWQRTLLFYFADIDKHGVESVHTKSAGDVAVAHDKSDDRGRHMVCDSDEHRCNENKRNL